MGRAARHPIREARRRSERRGRSAELLAAGLLMFKGYRILARRQRTPWGEIDLIAVRGRRLAFVEVKQRRSLADAQDALTPRQAERLARAAEQWVWRHAAYRDHEIGFDAVLLGRGGVPRHRPNVLQPG